MNNLEQGAARQSGHWKSLVARPFAGVWQFLSDAMSRSAMRDELADLDRRGGLDAFLQDIGLTLPEMERIVRGMPEAGRLLPAMAERQGVEIDSLDPRTRYVLRQTCATCAAHRRCRRYLAAADGALAESEEFCPNAELFDAIRAKAQHI